MRGIELKLDTHASTIPTMLLGCSGTLWDVTNQPPAQPLVCGRPQGDSNPRYRRERARAFLAPPGSYTFPLLFSLLRLNWPLLKERL